MRITLDAGHGGVFPGAVGEEPFRLEEKAVTLAVVLELGGVLEAQGHDVHYTRATDTELSEDLNTDLRMRAEAANNNGSDVFISVHCNSYSEVTAQGIETFHYPGSVDGEELAAAVQDRMMEAFSDHVNRGVKSANYAVLRLTNMAACLVETEFISHPDQLVFLSDPATHRSIAQAIANGISDFA